MSYRNKHGFTQITNGRFQNLSLNYDNDELHKKYRYPVLTFTPDMKDLNQHWHIQLNKKQARNLFNWLEKYLKDTK